jgi:hypothetical protein
MARYIKEFKKHCIYYSTPPKHISRNVADFQVAWNTAETLLPPLKLIHLSHKTSDFKQERSEINGYSYFSPAILSN